MYSIFKDTVADMTWLEIEEALQKGAVVLSPTGVIEQQSPHLPTGVDIYESHYICRYIKKRLEKENIPAIIAPPYYFDVNHITGAYKTKL
ncbi:creatininase family protein [Bacillus cereus group sp. BfR-BA-01380]|uniref:creatininase family protein n=1 Tax=Bacillus cereus group sp. BfR-BA-01380 TaxID=2920324 RepID=UPI001F586BD2|nr:creatininase family protein [Bacillus cereus group sp. BfR-BA-01380]